MSDFINGIGRGPASYGVGSNRSIGSAGAPTPGTEVTTESTSSAAGAESFVPTAEANESPQDSQAGLERASGIFSAWSPEAASTGPSAGSLEVQGAEQTAVHQVHGQNGGQYQGSQGPEAGFTAATVYSSRPPV